MSRKRHAGDQLTGGTGDVNPQYLSGQLILSAANIATEVVLFTPIVRIGPQTGGKTTIMELLKLWVDMPSIDAENPAAQGRIMQFSMSTSSSGATPAIMLISNAHCLAGVAHATRNAFTAAGSAMLESKAEPAVWDFTDGAGHGILVATDNLFIQGKTTNQTGISQFEWKLMYRFKSVSLVEYIGIVQSQQ